MITRHPYVRWNHNRFGDSRIVIACACGAGLNGDPDDPAGWAPHGPTCPLYKREEPPVGDVPAGAVRVRVPAVGENVKEGK